MLTPNLDQDFAPVFKATLGYIVMFYVFVFGQAASKVVLYLLERRKNPEATFKNIKYKNQDHAALTVDRTTGNAVEQGVMFMTSLWLCAVFASVEHAAKYGWIYVGFRSIYPICFYMGVHYVVISTIPNYICIISLLQPVVAAAYAS